MKDQELLLSKLKEYLLKFTSKRGNEYITSVNNCIIAHKLYLDELCDYTFENGEIGLKVTLELILYKRGKDCSLFCDMYLDPQHLDSTIPSFYIPINETTNGFNTTFLDEKGRVSIPLLAQWNENSSLQTVLYQIIDYLQFQNDYKRERTSIARHLSLDEIQESLPYILYSDIVFRSKLGQGTYSVVFKGKYQEKDVAIKVYKKALTGASLDSFEREVMIQSQLDHPNCLKLYGISYTHDSRPVLVMELADSTLQKYIIQQHTHLTLWEKRSLILEIAEGLAYLHKQGYIHRDIKMENILIKDGHAVIADFGFASKDEVKWTSGTPAFIAPEVIKDGVAKAPADVYSFGCVVNEIFSEKESYADYSFATVDDFYQSLLNGLRPTILDCIPFVVKSLIMDCFNSKTYRPPMTAIVDRIKNWTVKDLEVQ